MPCSMTITLVIRWMKNSGHEQFWIYNQNEELVEEAGH